MQVLRSGYNARDAWGAFNGLHQKVAKAALPANRPRHTKRERIREQRELTTRSGQDWHIIRADHPDNHVELKLDLGHAIWITNAASRLVERAGRNIDVQRESRLDEPVELYEDLIRFRVRLLAALNELATVEGRVGRGADFIWAHTNREIALLKRLIREASDYVASKRQDEEYDEYGSFIRRDIFQKNSLPTPTPGGRQWHSNIASGFLPCVGLFVSIDEHNSIRDRIVMKDMWFNTQPSLWTDLGFWMGDPQDPTSKVPYEVHIMGHLTATEQENILHMRSWRMAPENLMYRIYIEYCPNGDGNKLLEYYAALNRTNQQENSQQQNICIPEPAIWHIFNSLIKAGLTMEQVFVNDVGHVNAEVVHLDLKPNNIFLGHYPSNDPDSAPSNFAMYPTCKLGDLGMATYRHLAERRPTAYIGRGTGEFFAPERRQQYHGQKRPHLNAKTNVWGVGITVMALMNLDVTAGNLQFQQAATNESDSLLVPEFKPAAVAGYSAPLRQMVRSCMQYKQDDRPEFATLLTNLRQYTVPTSGLKDYALGARFATRDTLPAGMTLLDGLPANQYALGTAMPNP